jgi:hypothetical protein
MISALQNDLFTDFCPPLVTAESIKVEAEPFIGRRDYLDFDSDVVKQVVLSICQGEFVAGSDIFSHTGMYPGDVSAELSKMVGEGLLISKRNYFGSDHPGKPGYYGFHEWYMVKELVSC